MIFSEMSPKQLKSMLWWTMKDSRNYDAIVCDGSVRSGKTMSMSIGFVLWSMRNFNNENFAFCGKTIDSLKRNVITPMQKWLEGIVKLKINLSKNYMDITMGGHTNRYYMFGGKDESSYQLIQGITLAGALLDEVVLMPRSFVEQALARCSVTGSKFWFNCNPGNSLHWFYKEWVDDNSENAMQKNRLHLHLTMEDNYSLSDSVRQRYERMYSGVFYDRYIKGLWVSAEGVIYRDFAENTEKFMLDAPPDDIVFCTIGMDFGGNGSAHAMICTGFTKSLEKVIILDEYYRKEIISPAELEKDVCGFIRRCQQKYRVYDMYCDSAEQVLIKGIKSAVIHEHIPINVHNARKSEIIGRIRFFSSLMAQNRLLVMKQCTHLIEALQSAVWDSKSIKDVRLDNGEYNIDSLDALEYSAEPFMNDILSIHK